MGKNREYKRKRYRKNSKKNPWRNTKQRVTVKKTIEWKKLLAFFLVITIPATCFCLVAGSVLRISDVYQYNLSSTQAVENHIYVVEAEDVAQTMSDYVNGKDNELVLMEDVEYEPENVFTKQDQESMKKLKTWEDVLLIIGAASLIVTALIYFLLIRWRENRIHRKCVKLSAIFFAATLVISAVLKLVPALQNLFYIKMLGMDFKEEDYIYMIFGETFPTQIVVFESIASIALFGIICYVTWKLIGVHKMFKRGETL